MYFEEKEREQTLWVLDRKEEGIFGTFFVQKVQLSPDEKTYTFEIDQKFMID